MEDREIVALFFARSERAIEELSRKYGRVCARLAKNILNNEQDAEECVNDAHLAVWNTVPPQNPDPLPAYLCRIVRNLSVKRYHANTAQKRDSSYDVALSELEGCVAQAETPESVLSARELTRLLDSFLDGLDRESRVMFVRRYWYADGVGEIAARLGATPGSVSTRLSRVRGKLRDYLKREGVNV